VGKEEEKKERTLATTRGQPLKHSSKISLTTLSTTGGDKKKKEGGEKKGNARTEPQKGRGNECDDGELAASFVEIRAGGKKGKKRGRQDSSEFEEDKERKEKKRQGHRL